MTLKKLKTLLLLSSLAPLAACSMIPQTATGDDVACLAFMPMTYSAKNDTPATVEEIREFNAQRKAICKE